MKIKLVLNTSYGGFSIDNEMAEWLSSKRNWIILPDIEYDYKKEYPLNCLFKNNYGIFSPNDKKIDFRAHTDLIDCVKEIKKRYEDKPYMEWAYCHIKTLSVIEMEITLCIEDYNDGHERVYVETQIND